MSKIAEMVDAYLAGVGRLRQAVAGLSREQLLARPIPGKWSTLEVVCHLADFEPVLADRMKRIIALERPPLAAADENLYAAKLAYHARDLSEELAVIDVTRKQMARILRPLPDTALDRVGIHSERGPRTLAEILSGATNHIAHHLPFIAEKRKALGAAT
jgi:uncharacterized damage-inducible protein DinB